MYLQTIKNNHKNHNLTKKTLKTHEKPLNRPTRIKNTSPNQKKHNLLPFFPPVLKSPKPQKTNHRPLCHAVFFTIFPSSAPRATLLRSRTLSRASPGTFEESLYLPHRPPPRSASEVWRFKVRFFREKN